MSNMNFQRVAIVLGMVVVLTNAARQNKEALVLSRQEEEPAGFFNSIMQPAINLIQATTRQVLKQFRSTLSSVDTHVGAVRETVGQIAGNIGKNALGDVIDNMRLFRGRVTRLLNVVKGAQKSVQGIMDNSEVNSVFRASLLPLSMGLATLEGQVGGLNVVVNAGTSNLEESTPTALDVD